jgi:3-hydroxybutyryl-CoA dehydrogenase
LAKESTIRSKRERGPVDVAVIGLGLMGRSIAACLLSAGHRVIGLTDDLAASKQAPQKIRRMLVEMHREKLLKRDPAALIKNFLLSSEISDLAKCGIIFESVTEDVELKRSIFRELEKFITPSAIIATNTSAIPVTILQKIWGTRNDFSLFIGVNRRM